jgi:hypothetical protein
MDKNDTNKNPIGEEFNEVEKEMRTRFSLLPEDLQKTINSSEYQMRLYEIAKTVKLTYEQLGTLEMETTMVLLGMTPPDEFQEEIQSQLKLDPKTASEIVGQINEQVFKTIRESLKKVYTAKDQSEDAITNGLNPDQTRAELKKSGIEINKIPTNTIVKPNTPTINPAQRDKLLSGIENPPKGSGLSLAEQKLAGTFSMPTKETSYVPKTLPPVAPVTKPANTTQTAPTPTRQMRKPSSSRVDSFLR